MSLWFQASASVEITSSFCWNVLQCWLVVTDVSGQLIKVISELTGSTPVGSRWTWPFNRYCVPLGTEIQVMAVLSLYEDPAWFQGHISNILRVQGKWTQIVMSECYQSFTPTQNMIWVSFLCSTPPAQRTFCEPHYAKIFFMVIHPVRRPVYKHPGLRLLKTNIIVAIAR